MKKLPKYFVIERDDDNPLWEKYINWLDKTYGFSWIGDDFKYYGYDDNKYYKGTDCRDSLDNFKNNPTLITLEEWDKAINSFVLPKSWYIVVDEDNFEDARDWRFEGCTPHDQLKPGCITGMHKYGTKEWDINEQSAHNYGKRITTEQFRKYVLMKDDKKIIGYNLKKGYEKYEEAACRIIAPHTIYKKAKTFKYLGNNSKSVLFEYNSLWFEMLQEAKVLDLWFEPVYATEYSLPKINGYDGKIIQDGKVIKYGCAEISIQALVNIWDVSTRQMFNSGNRKLMSIRLDSGVEITMKQVKEILDYVKHVKQ